MKHRVLLDAAAIASRVAELADEIAAVMPREFVVVGVLRASFVFVADLVRQLDRAGAAPLVEFVQLSSYGAGRTGGAVQLVGAPPQNVAGREVVVVDTVVESGRSLVAAREILRAQSCGQVRTCALIEKRGGNAIAPRPDFIGFAAAADQFLVGYGLDDGGQLRHLRHVAVVE